MKIGFIAPSWDLFRKHKGDKIFFLAPLTFPVLAALTPDNIEIDVIEERVRPIVYTTDYDLVGITFVTAFAPRAYEIADRFRELGVKVVLGGSHASVMPHEAIQHADTVVIGEAEETWTQLLKDFRLGKLEKFYSTTHLLNMQKFPHPKLDIIPKEFMFRKATLASKGCPFRCNFCFINKINQYQQRFRPISDVYDDIASMTGNGLDRKYFIFWDDNLAGNLHYTKALCRAIMPLKKRWAGAASVSIASDPEMLTLLEKAGCIALFIGFESINSASLNQSQKFHNHVRKYREIITRLHDHGIAITGAFMFGFDQDDHSVFERTLEFCLSINLDCITPALVTPLPATQLYTSLAIENRIVDFDWSHYDYQHVVFKPKNFNRNELYESYILFLNEFFSFHSIYKRLGHSRTHLIISTLLNLGYHKFYQRLLDDLNQLYSNQKALNAISPQFRSSNQISASKPVKQSVYKTRKKAFYNTSPSRNFVKVLIDSDEIFPFVFQMIRKANKSIHIEMYVFEGEIGNRILSALKKKAKEGVKVRIIYQPSGTLKLYNEIMAIFHRLGFTKRAIHYNTFANELKTDPQFKVISYPLHRFQCRSTIQMAHNKMLIVDGEEAMMGGMNFASITETNHDAMVYVRGPIVYEMEKAFQQTWILACGAWDGTPLSYAYEHKNKEKDPLPLVSFHITHPLIENTKSLLIQQIEHAKSQILVEMYLFIDKELASALIDAHQRKIDVRVLLDSNPLPLDFDFNGFPNKRMIHMLVKGNVQTNVYLTRPGQEMHMKLVLFDDDKVIVGSTNWTRGSFTSNSESCFFIQNDLINQKFKNMFEWDWKNKSVPAKPLTYYERLFSSCTSFFDRIY